MSNDLTVRSEGKMVSDTTWNTLYKQGAELIKSGFLPKAITTPAQAVAVILTGRELGLGIMESLRGIYIIENKPSVSPQLMLSLIYNSGVIEDLKINSQPTFCEVEGNRKGMSLIKVRFTEEDAKDLGLLFRDNWKRQKQNMLRWRAISAWARLVCPDVIGGLYTPEELESSDDIVGKDESALALSEKVHSNPVAAEDYAQDLKTRILDDIATCENPQQLSHVKKQYESDIGRLMDEDRAFILEEFDHAFQNLVSGPEVEIQADGSVKDRQTGQEVELEAGTQENGNSAPKQATFEELNARQDFGQAFLKQAAVELKLCTTKAQLTVFKTKKAEGRMKLLPEHKEYFDALLKQAFDKVK